MQFAKAKPMQAFLKIGFYGPQGSGKTFTTLLIAEGLAQECGKRIAFVDTERGTDFYATGIDDRKIHPGAFDFDALYTRSLSDVLEAVRSIDFDKYGVLVLDSISHLWDAAIEAYEGKMVGKTGDKIPMQAWGSIKRPYKQLIRYLLDCPAHVFILGRQKNIFENDGDNFKKVGVAMRAEGETEYEPHICIRMEKSADRSKSDVIAIVEKDRTGILQGDAIVNPNFNTFKPLLPYLGSEQAMSEDPDEVSARDSELLDETSKAADKEAKSQERFARLHAELAGATALEQLSEAGKAIKKEKRYMLDRHVESLRMVYEQRRAELTAALAPAEV